MIGLKRAFRGRAPGILCCVLALVSTALVSACSSGPDPSSATINYQEVSVCTANGSSGVGPDFQIYLVFEITSVSNTGPTATSFTFNPNLLYLSGQNGHDYPVGPHAYGGLSLNGAPFGFAQTQTVPAGSTVSVNAGVVVIDTVDPGGSDIQNSNIIDFHLLYSPPAGTEGADAVKTNANAPQYPTQTGWGCPHPG